MQWTELIVHTTSEATDRVSDVLVESGATGTMIEDRSDIPDPNRPHGYWEIIDPRMIDRMPEDVLVHAWFEKGSVSPSFLDGIRSRLLASSGGVSCAGSLEIELKTVDEDAWADTWKDSMKAFYAAEHLLIRPTWDPADPDPEDRIIEIDPGMAFGSGTHETTVMCLSMLNEIIRGGESVIDVGTGSGILAIGAALLGAGNVLAIDIDPDAVKVAEANVLHNRVHDIVTVRQGDLLEETSAVCDICVVNIITEIAISYATPLKSHIRPGGLLICSGIVASRKDDVRQALEAAEYEILREEIRGEWAAFLSRRNV